jgi:hypothetical protein
MPLEVFEPTTPARKWPQTYALDRAATRIGRLMSIIPNNWEGRPQGYCRSTKLGPFSGPNASSASSGRGKKCYRPEVHPNANIWTKQLLCLSQICSFVSHSLIAKQVRLNSWPICKVRWSGWPPAVRYHFREFILCVCVCVCVCKMKQIINFHGQLYNIQESHFHSKENRFQFSNSDVYSSW